jgi:Sodium:sulfate symporter transmembrane region
VSSTHEPATQQTVAASASGPAAINAAAASEPEGFKWGADMKKLGLCVGLGTAMWFVPPPTGVTSQAWHLLSIFVATILGIITQPLPLGAVAMLGLGVSMVTSTLQFEQAFMAFSSQIPCDPCRALLAAQDQGV